jgi:hypothetical protein
LASQTPTISPPTVTLNPQAPNFFAMILRIT